MSSGYSPPEVYAQHALSQVPRLLGNQDRDPFSPTYGCLHHDYWLDKVSDFPDAVRQFGVHALALVYSHKFPGSQYYHNERVLEWAIAGLDFWASIQHRDGSFDEFYPYERGWVGPTAFTTYTAVESYRLLEEGMGEEVRNRVRGAIGRAADFIASGDKEEDHLANHHAMACLAVWKAAALLRSDSLRADFEHLWSGFVTYHDADEGWSREYDGIDPGYLSATVSFLAKIYQEWPDESLKKVLSQSIEVCGYFVYPNGFYAGSMGSRNTLHFYPHGFEIMGRHLPMAQAVCEPMLRSLTTGGLVPPEIMSDRYVGYRVPEYLLAYLDHAERTTPLPELPHQKSVTQTHLRRGGIVARTIGEHFLLVNYRKGGVVKVFERTSGRLRFNDCGVIGTLTDGTIVSSQWVDPEYEVLVNDNGGRVSGRLQRVPTHRVFTLWRNILFRSVLAVMGPSRRVLPPAEGSNPENPHPRPETGFRRF